MPPHDAELVVRVTHNGNAIAAPVGLDEIIHQPIVSPTLEGASSVLSWSAPRAAKRPHSAATISFFQARLDHPRAYPVEGAPDLLRAAEVGGIKGMVA